MASTTSCVFELVLVILKLLEIACSLLELSATTFLRRLNGRHDAEPVHIPSVASVTSNELCLTCQGIVEIISHPGWYKDLVHHASLASLEKSCAQFCGMCAETLEHMRRRYTDSFDTLFPIECESDTSSASWQSSFELTLTSHKVKDFKLGFTFETIERPQSKRAEYRPCSSTDSPESWDLIVRWMNQCTQSHDRCKAAIPERWFPTRVLDIGAVEKGRVRLISNEDIIPGQPYATLSHCWGRSIQLTTTAATFSARLDGIDVEHLPKTFLDAVGIARRLGLRYLWIDALCIIQDSIDDWMKEADLMSLVYRYCYINIAATGSEDGTGGCFRNRIERDVLPTQVHIQWYNSQRNRNRKMAGANYRVVLEPNLWTRKLTNEPLNRRAWILQERILPSRVLHFGSKQLFWECRESVACETYPRSLPASLQSHPLINIKRLQLGQKPKDNRWPASYASEDRSEFSYVRKLWHDFAKIFRPVVIRQVTLSTATSDTSVFHDWNAVVELYSMCRLTFRTDKLVALSGLAQTIIAARSDQLDEGYLAGLWQSSLPASLLWQPAYTELTHGTRYTAGMTAPCRYADENTGSYIAPTWSWASIDGQVSFASFQVNYKSEDYLATVEDAGVSYFGDYRFGHVTSGFVTLSGPIASALWAIKNPQLSADTTVRHGGYKMMIITHLFPPHLTRHAAVKLDTTDPVEIEGVMLDTVMHHIPEELILFSIVETTESNGNIDMVRGLVLQRASHDDDYVRIGVFSARRKQLRRMLVNMPQRSITIR